MGYKNRQRVSSKQKRKRKQRRQKILKKGLKVDELYYDGYYVGARKS